MTRILLTGFEPFGEFKLNPTETIVRILTKEAASKLKGLHAVVLPVSLQASETVNALLKEGYEYVLHLGLHPRIEDIAIERVAINMDDYEIPDNDGKVVRDKPIDPLGKNAYFVTLPVRKIEKALKDRGIPCHISYSAGTYLCNHLLYTTLNFIEKNRIDTRAGFLHLPSEKRMNLDRMVEGVKAVLEVLGFPLS